MIELKIIDEFLEKNENDNSNLSKLLAGISEGANDWPNSVPSVEDYFQKIKESFGQNTTLEGFKKARIPIDFSKNSSWEYESLASLICGWELFPKLADLEQVLAFVRKELKLSEFDIERDQ